MCRRSRRGRRRCVFTFWEKEGGGILRANPGVGGSWVGNLRVFLFFRPPTFFTLSSVISFRRLPPRPLLPLHLFGFSFPPFSNSRWKMERGRRRLRRPLLRLQFRPFEPKKNYPFLSLSPPFDPTFLSLFLFLRWRRRRRWASSSFPSSPRPPAPPHISFVPKRRRPSSSIEKGGGGGGRSQVS